MTQDECYRLGKITKPFGFKGQVIFFLDVDSPEDYEELDSVFLELSLRVELHAEVESCLPAESREHTVRPLHLYDLRDSLFRQRLHVDFVGDAVVCHDRRRVAVDQYRLDTLFRYRLACLRPRVVELGSLSYNDRT